MSGALKLLLVVVLVPAHVPVCKLAAVNARPLPPSAPAVPPCCSKCQQKPAPRSIPASPRPEKPTKPTCPPNSVCPFCTPLPAVAPTSTATAELDCPVTERLAAIAQIAPPDGVHALPDRPPRA